MPRNTNDHVGATRAVLIVLLVLVSIGLIGYSVRAISFPVGSKRVGELAVTEMSLTHAVLRGPDGKLFNPTEPREEQEVAQPEKPRKSENKPAVTPLKSKPAPVQELAAKKSPPPNKKAKPPAKIKPKPKPKKPPKKPANPQGSQACPT